MTLSLGPWMDSVRAGGTVPEIPERWDHFIMVRSIGRVGPEQGAGTPEEADRGFHVVTLDLEGAPEYYWKFRSLPDSGDQHPEVHLIDRFRADPRTAPLLLRTWSGTRDGVQVQAAEVLSWPRMDEVLRSRDREAIRSAIGVAFQAAELLTRVGGEWQGETSPGLIELQPEDWPTSLEYQALALEVERLTPLRKVLDEAGRLPGELQHGDYWPSNVFVGPSGQCRVLDLDEFGRVAAPGYDLLHLCRTSSDFLRGGRSTSWLERLRRPSPFEEDMQGILRASFRQKGFSAATVEALVSFYLLDILIRTFRRGGPEEFWGRLRDDVGECADILATGRSGGVLQRVLGTRSVGGVRGERHA